MCVVHSSLCEITETFRLLLLSLDKMTGWGGLYSSTCTVPWGQGQISCTKSFPPPNREHLGSGWMSSLSKLPLRVAWSLFSAQLINLGSVLYSQAYTPGSGAAMLAPSLGCVCVVPPCLE